MASLDKNKKLRPSILDRLLDDDPENVVESEPDQHHRLRELRASVQRDMETLMNTRLRLVEPDEEYDELRTSLLNYGLPDLATVNLSDKKSKKAFIENLEKLLIEFEPRFKSVNVQYLENTETVDRTVRFRIEATLYADPMPEMVVFDSVMEPVSRSVNIEEAGYG